MDEISVLDEPLDDHLGRCDKREKGYDSGNVTGIVEGVVLVDRTCSMARREAGLWHS